MRGHFLAKLTYNKMQMEELGADDVSSLSK